MTPEQTKVIDRCGRMLRRAFLGLEGRILYRFKKDKPYFDVDYGDSRRVPMSEDGDIVFEEEGVVVDMRD